MVDVKNYEGIYAITSCGKVFSYRSNKFLKAKKSKKDGYWRINLSKDGIAETFLIHRLVAEAYIQNEQNLETVDHIDGNKDHNYVNNLRWMTRGDNTKKACSKSVHCVELNKDFESAAEAARQLGLHPQCISACCKGKRKTTGKLHFNYTGGEGDV